DGRKVTKGWFGADQNIAGGWSEDKFERQRRMAEELPEDDRERLSEDNRKDKKSQEFQCRGSIV
ncbi:unnamed protein product, partial [Ilex paraguariensis]